MLLFERLGFQLLQQWEEADRLGRPDIRWNSFLFELDSTRGRPLDRIERVLNRMSKMRVTVAEALNRLVVNPTDERNVGAAKDVFDRMPEKRCVWSDKPLRVGYAVDHVIPFSLWHCNDLWNLLPCDARVNGSKRDRLPERGLLLQRKDPIVFYWESGRAQHERRFDHELVNLAGVKVEGNWQNAAFQRLVEAVEVPASPAPRWTGRFSTTTPPRCPASPPKPLAPSPLPSTAATSTRASPVSIAPTAATNSFSRSPAHSAAYAPPATSAAPSSKAPSSPDEICAPVPHRHLVLTIP